MIADMTEHTSAHHAEPARQTPVVEHTDLLVDAAELLARERARLVEPEPEPGS